MARKRKLTVSVATIHMHPHSENEYEALLTSTYRMRLPIKVYGDQYIIMSSLRREGQGASRKLRGELSKFTRIDLDGPWFDMSTLGEADEDDIEQISIPENLHPNLHSFSFAFFPRHHFFVFESYGGGRALSQRMLQKYLETAFMQGPIVRRFPSVGVDIVADHRQLDAIFNLSLLEELRIHISRPNPDHWDDDLDKDIEERLTEQNAQSFDLSYEAIKGMSLKPSEKTKSIATVALKNGEVIGK